jgi:thiol:disulfide interchange protein DsbD
MEKAFDHRPRFPLDPFKMLNVFPYHLLTKISGYFVLIIFLSVFSILSTPAEAEPLKPEQAFSFQATAIRDDLLEIRFQIAPGHYLYREKFQFSLEAAGMTLGSPQFPAGQFKEDPAFGRTEIFQGQSKILLPLTSGPKAEGQVILAVTYQGCAEAGLCYPPKTKKIPLRLRPLPTAGSPAGVEAGPVPLDGGSWGRADIAGLFQGRGFLWIILSFLGFGLLLSFTPCVFPMIPILSGIIIAQGQGLTKQRSFLLSLTYVMGMALAYTAAGVAAGLSGRFISGVLQNQWVLIGLAFIFILLALSMFGVYELQIPGFIQSKLTGLNPKSKTGGFPGVFLMGLLSALIIGPCVTAPLAGALLFIGQTHNLWLGGAALFALSMGMGIPLLLIGTSAGALLPKAGKWMQGVKIFFGILLVALAFWTVSPLIPQSFTPALSFQRITRFQEFKAFLGNVSKEPALLYFSADWCTSCKEIELLTFRDKEIKAGLLKLKRFKADVTAADREAETLLKEFGLFGPPALLFFDQRGRELPGTRVIGVPKKDNLKQTLENILKTMNSSDPT